MGTLLTTTTDWTDSGREREKGTTASLEKRPSRAKREKQDGDASGRNQRKKEVAG